MKASFKAVGRGLGLFLMFALCAAGAAAQQAGASLRGQVSDEFGGVIVGASVTVTDASGKAKSTVTDSDGAFNVPGLAPGRYSVRVYSTGFAPFENPEVDLRAGRNELPKVTLGVSLEKEEVTVASEGPLSVDTASAGAIVLKGKDIEALPEDPDELAAALSALAGPAAGPNGGQITIDGFEGGRIPSKPSMVICPPLGPAAGPARAASAAASSSGSSGSASRSLPLSTMAPALAVSTESGP